MATLKYANQSGTVYVYDVVYEWDPVKKRSKSKRKVIGKIDPATGEMIPTSGKRGRTPKSDNKPDPAGKQPAAEQIKLETSYRSLESDYRKLQEQNTALKSENEKLKTLLRKFCKEASDYL